MEQATMAVCGPSQRHLFFLLSQLRLREGRQGRSRAAAVDWPWQGRLFVSARGRSFWWAAVAEAPVTGFHSTYSRVVPLIWHWMQRIPSQEPSTVEEQCTAEVKETAYCSEGLRATGGWGPPPPGPGRHGWLLGTSKRMIVHTSPLLASWVS